MGGGRGKGIGTGSPIAFRCNKCRSTLVDRRDTTVELTGRERPYKPKRFQLRGPRTSDVAREYRCSCGHVGWSAHVDLERRYPDAPTNMV